MQDIFLNAVRILRSAHSLVESSPNADMIFSRAYVQGGSDGMPILGDFAVKYFAQAEQLGVPTVDLYQALVDTAENTVSVLFRTLDFRLIRII